MWYIINIERLITFENAIKDIKYRMEFYTLQQKTPKYFTLIQSFFN